MVSGIAVLPQISAKNLALKLNIVVNVKDDANPEIINYPAQYQSLAQSVMIDNQDTGNPVTVRINRQVNSVTIGASDFRAYNDTWIEQIDLTGASTNTQVTSQVSPLTQISPIYSEASGATN